MIEKLKLKWNELVIYASIYSYSESWYNNIQWSLNSIVDWLHISKQTVISSLKKLIDKWLIKKEINSSWNIYNIINK